MLPFKRIHKPIKHLTKDEQLSFRDDFKEKEREIQRFIGIYLSSLVVVAGWFLRPEAVDIYSVAFGNFGYNVYAIMVVILVNVLFSTFLIYKSLIIHEIMQFVSIFGEKGSVFGYWEWWRRSKFNETRWARNIYGALISLLPFSVSIAGLYFLYFVLFSEVPTHIGEEPVEFRDQISSVFVNARWWYLGLTVLHTVPLFFFGLQLGPIWWRWSAIERNVEPEGLEEYVKSIVKRPPATRRTSGHQPVDPPDRISKGAIGGTDEEE